MNLNPIPTGALSRDEIYYLTGAIFVGCSFLLNFKEKVKEFDNTRNYLCLTISIIFWFFVILLSWGELGLADAASKVAP